MTTPTELRAQAAATLSPAALLAKSTDERYEVAETLNKAHDRALDEVERLERELAAAKFTAAFYEGAAYTADAIANAEVDSQHERRVGDVLIAVDSELEHLVISIRSHTGVVEYLTIPYAARDARPGDGAPGAWHFAGYFRRP